MKHHKVSIRFSSEAHFEKFPFNSETITVKEIIDHLGKVKKLDSDKKTDKIVLYKEGDMTKEVTGNVEAGTRLIVKRSPEPFTNKQANVNVTGPQNTSTTVVLNNNNGQGDQPIEVAYTPKQANDSALEREKRRKMAAQAASLLDNNSSKIAEKVESSDDEDESVAGAE